MRSGQSLFQGGAVGECRVGGDLDLVGCPVVAAEPSLADLVQTRVASGDQADEQGRPVGTRQPVGDLLGLVEDLGHVEERVGVTGVGDALGVQVPGQPFPAVDPDLNCERKPDQHVARPSWGCSRRGSSAGICAYG